MESERWHKINRLFHAALEINEADRNLFLRTECAGDPELFDEIQRFLKAHSEADDFIESPAVDKALDLLAGDEPEPNHFIGQQFGVYKIIEEIGRGGMGAVFLAERTDQQFEKRVAIKIIKRGMDTEEVLRRFRHERQILAHLEHPHIARLLDGGTTDNGLPYFVMEYIEGIPIRKYAGQQKLPLKEHLKLFRKVCAAVAYAHQRLIIHRDIKSSNIIVTADGTPKLLDFGIAKLMTNEPFSGKSIATRTGLRLMTPEYASPEQFKGEDVTTATDIYSLGVVLYELLTGHRPFDQFFQETGTMSPAVLNTDPPKPSDLVLGNRSRRISEVEDKITRHHSEEFPATEIIDESKTNKLIEATKSGPLMPDPKALRGDIDNIILKALRKEPENRYLTVDQFSEDIRRHLAGLPVIARPLSLPYRLTKFIGRNKIQVGLATIIFITLIGGIITTTWQSVRANRQKELAEKRFNEVRKLANSVLFDYHDAIKDLPGSTPVRARIVRDALKYLDSLASEGTDDISLQKELAAAYEKIGDVQGGTMFANLGDTKNALESYRKSLQIRNEILSGRPNDFDARRDVALGSVKLGNLLWETGDVDSALDHNKKALTIFRQLISEKPDQTEILYHTGRTYGYLGNIIHDRGEFDTALGNFQNELKSYQSLPKTDLETENIRRAVSLAFEHIGIVHISVGNYEKALENNTQALNIRKQLSEEFPLNADYQRTLAVSYYNEGEILGNLARYREALESYRKDVLIVEKLAVKDPQNEQYRGDIAYGYIRFGDMETKLGNPVTALKHYQRSEAIRTEDVKADPSNLWKKSSLIEANAKICKTFSITKQLSGMAKKCAETYTQLETTEVDPNNSVIRSFFAETYANIGEAYLNASQKGRACSLFKKAFSIYQDLSRKNMLAKSESEKSEILTRQIKTCDGDFQ